MNEIKNVLVYDKTYKKIEALAKRNYFTKGQIVSSILESVINDPDIVFTDKSYK